MIDPVPSGSIYFWMYQQGVKGVSYRDIITACDAAGVEIRDKDERNYFNGRYKHDLYLSHRDLLAYPGVGDRPDPRDMHYEEFPYHPFLNRPEIEQRWVPCNADGHPLYKWSKGCLSYTDAVAIKQCESLAENLKGTKHIVIDCDGDHNKEQLDYETIAYLSKYLTETHALAKPMTCNEYSAMPFGTEPLAYLPASFHLTFSVNRVIPTMHFPKAHIDIIGNKANSLRYLKNKVWNQIDPIPMTEDIWQDIMGYIRKRELTWR